MHVQRKRSPPLALLPFRQPVGHPTEQSTSGDVGAASSGPRRVWSGTRPRFGSWCVSRRAVAHRGAWRRRRICCAPYRRHSSLMRRIQGSPRSSGRKRCLDKRGSSLRRSPRQGSRMASSSPQEQVDWPPLPPLADFAAPFLTAAAKTIRLGRVSGMAEMRTQGPSRPKRQGVSCAQRGARCLQQSAGGGVSATVGDWVLFASRAVDELHRRLVECRPP